MTEEALKKRTKKFALDIFKLIEALPKSVTSIILSNQIGKSGSSVAANYRASCRARNRAEFISKMENVLKDTDETALWLEMIIDSKLTDNSSAKLLLKEANDLISIFIRSIKTAKSI